jgi:hypothetical protein
MCDLENDLSVSVYDRHGATNIPIRSDVCPRRPVSIVQLFLELDRALIVEEHFLATIEFAIQIRVIHNQQPAIVHETLANLY